MTKGNNYNQSHSKLPLIKKKGGNIFSTPARNIVDEVVGKKNSVACVSGHFHLGRSFSFKMNNNNNNTKTLTVYVH